jgi:hypothetical protein
MRTDGEEIIASQLDYKKHDYMYPIYKHSKILPLAGGQAFAVPNTGGTETLFELPAKVLNLSKSYISFTASIVGLANTGNFVVSDIMPSFRQVQLYTRGGLFLADINNFDDYTKAVLKIETKMEEYLTWDKYGHLSGTSNSLRQNNVVGVANNLGCRYGVGVAGDANVPARSNGSAASVSYIEPTYLSTSSAQGNNEPTISYKLNLGIIKNTIFSLDKDLLFDEVIVLRIVWNAPQKYIFTVGLTVVDPMLAGAVAYAGAVNITGLQAFIAIETNQEVVQQIRDKKNSGTGLEILFPYVYGNKVNLTGNSQSVSLRFNRGHGLRLLKVFHLPIWGAETIQTAYDSSNINGTKINNFYTLLNSNRLQEFNVDCTQQEDYMLLKDKLRGSVISSSNMYQHNWTWVDDFSGYISAIDENSQHPDDDTFVKGIDLSTEQKWDIYLTVTGSALASIVGQTALNHYTFAVTQKMLVIGPGGIQVM